jgi:hypothetical protein
VAGHLDGDDFSLVFDGLHAPAEHDLSRGSYGLDEASGGLPLKRLLEMPHEPRPMRGRDELQHGLAVVFNTPALPINNEDEFMAETRVHVSCSFSKNRWNSARLDTSPGLEEPARSM